MTHRRQMLAVLAGSFFAAGWASGSSAHPASHVARHPVAIDSTDYQSQEQLLANTQVMVVARVESVGRDRSAPTSQPAVLVTLQVHDVIRGRVGKQIVVAQPRAASSATGQVEQMPLRSNGHTCSCWPGSGVADPLPSRRRCRGIRLQQHNATLHQDGRVGDLGGIRLCALVGEDWSRDVPRVDPAELAHDPGGYGLSGPVVVLHGERPRDESHRRGVSQ